MDEYLLLSRASKGGKMVFPEKSPTVTLSQSAIDGRRMGKVGRLHEVGELGKIYGFFIGFSNSVNPFFPNGCAYFRAGRGHA